MAVAAPPPPGTAGENNQALFSNCGSITIPATQASMGTSKSDGFQAVSLWKS